MGKEDAKAIISVLSLLAVALLLVSSLAPILSDSSVAEGADPQQAQAVTDGKHTITYHYLTGDAESSYEGDIPDPVTAYYYGIAATEYNPSYWKGTIDELAEGSSDNDWAGPEFRTEVDMGAKTVASAITVTLDTSAENYGTYLSIGGVGSIRINGLDSEGNYEHPEDGTELFTIDVGVEFSNLKYGTATGAGTDTQLWIKYLLDQGNISGPQSHFAIVLSPSDDGKTIIGSYLELGSGGQWIGSNEKGAMFPLSFSRNFQFDVGSSIAEISGNKVFCGWRDGNGAMVYPGDVVPNTVTDLYADWAVPDAFIDGMTIDIVPTGVGNEYEAEVVADYHLYKVVTGALPTSAVTAGHYYWNGTGYSTSGTPGMFTTIFMLSGDVTTPASLKLPVGTYRGADYGEVQRTSRIVINNLISTSGDVIIDNVILRQTADSADRLGQNMYSAICASYHRLIVGTGIISQNGMTYNPPNLKAAPSIYGGNNGSTALIEDKQIVSDANSSLNGFTAKLATFVIVHSGTYAHIYAGSTKGDIGASTSADTSRSTYLVIKGATALGVVGGTAGTSNVKSSTNQSYVGTPVQQGTFVYTTGLKMVGDRYEDRATGFTDHPLEWSIDESTAVQGGSYSGRVDGSTHLFVSGRTNVYDVQGAGRQGNSFCGHTYVELTGKAIVRHVACGTLQDGGNSASVKSVDVVVRDSPTIAMLFGAGYDTWSLDANGTMKEGGTIKVDIGGGTIGYLYGGSMRGNLGSTTKHVNITITMTAGHVVYDLFGGGRGGLDKIHHKARVTDPLGDPGRWDKTADDPGTNFDKAALNTTGYSSVYGDISINITGGRVDGSVYGGGESLPAVNDYIGAWKLKGYTGGNKPVGDVACVFGNVGVNVTGNAIVGGSVYGAGKGIALNYDEDTETYSVDLSHTVDIPDYASFPTGLEKMPYYSAMMIYNDGFKFIPWMMKSDNSASSYEGLIDENGVGKVTYHEDADSIAKYVNYAKVTGKTTVTVSASVAGSVYGGGQIGITDAPKNFSGTLTNVVVNDGARITGSVYGGGFGTVGEDSVNGSTSVQINGGNIGKVYGGAAFGVVKASNVTLSGGTITGNVYGGGEGQLKNTSIKGDVSVTVNDGTVVNGNLYGGSAFGIVKGNIVTTVNGGTVNGSLYGGGLGGLGVISTEKNRTVTLNGGELGYVFGGSSNGDDCTADATGVTAVVLNGCQVLNNVYAGGGLNRTYGSTVLTINACNVRGNVFGGGLGTQGVVSVYGPSSVDMTSGIIMGSLYGGSAYGITNNHSAVTISGCEINGSVFGAGLGVPGVVSVNGGSSIDISGGHIVDSVFGGAEDGKVVGGTDVLVSGGSLDSSVYSGGKGQSGYIAIVGDKTVKVTNATVYGSVYGGSAYGDDKKTEDSDNTADSYVIIGPAGNGICNIGGSVFGAGFRGKAYTDTHVFIGYYDDGDEVRPCNAGSLTIGQSVYGGGDVGEVAEGEAFQTITVFGDTNVHVNGKMDISFSGSILGSGNSCKISGEAQIIVDSLNLNNDIIAIHRADKVYLKTSNITFQGMSNGTADRTPYSLYGIEDLYLMDSTVHFNSAVSDVYRLHSQTTSGIYTTSSSPRNKIYTSKGSMLSFKKGESDYGDVTGYTILSQVDSSSEYGAYAFGGFNSSGGFVIEYGGNYRVADTQPFEGICMCWYISGTTNIDSAITLFYNDQITMGNPSTTSAVITVPLLSTDWRFTYGGSLFFSNSLDSYVIVQGPGGVVGGKYGYSVLFGTDNGNILFNDGAGTYVINDMTSGSDTATSDTVRPAKLEFTVSGPNISSSFDVGSIYIYFQEVSYLDIGGGKTESVVYHTILLNLSISNMSSSEPSNGTISIQTVAGAGSSTFIISPGFTDFRILYMGASQYIDGRMKIAASYNNGNTLGWTKTSVNRVNEISPGFEIGRLNGGYPATLTFSVEDWDTTNEFDIAFRFINGDRIADFTVKVQITAMSMVSVDFVDPETFTHITKRFTYGSIIEESQTPATASNFVGWYYDKSYLNEYTYTTPVISDLTLYARYLYQVTFVIKDGETSTEYVRMIADGSMVKKPEPDPSREDEGYEFLHWYVKDNNVDKVWDFNKDKITGTTVFYARWDGMDMDATLAYTIYDSSSGLHYSGYYIDAGEFGRMIFCKTGSQPGGTYWYYTGESMVEVTSEIVDGRLISMTQDANNVFVNYTTVKVGTRYGNLIFDAEDAVKGMISNLGLNPMQVRWTIGDNIITGNTAVEYLTGGHAILNADVPIDSVEVILDPNNVNAMVEGPADFFITEHDSKYTFVPSDALSTNGRAIIGWSDNKDYYTQRTGLFQEPGVEWEFSSNYAFPVIDGVRTLRLYAVWELIDYTVIISDPVGGNIKAYYNGTPSDVFEGLHYDDRLTLRFEADTGYRLGEWIVYGEGTVLGDEESGYYLDVKGPCTINVRSVGLATAYIDLSVVGEVEESVYGDVAFYLCDVGTGDVRLEITSMQKAAGYVTYLSPCDIGEYVLKVRSNGVVFQVYDSETKEERIVYVNAEGIRNSVTLYSVKSQIESIGPDVHGEARLDGLPAVISLLPAGQSYKLTVGEHYEVTEDITIGDNVIIAVGETTGEFNIEEFTEGSTTVVGTIETVKRTVTFNVPDADYNDQGTKKTGKFRISDGSEWHATSYSKEVYYGVSLSTVIPGIDDGTGVLIGYKEFSPNENWMIFGWYPNKQFNGEIDLVNHLITTNETVYGEAVYNTYVKFYIDTYVQSPLNHLIEDYTQTHRWYRIDAYPIVPHDVEPQYDCAANAPTGYYVASQDIRPVWEGDEETGAWHFRIHYLLKTAASPKFDTTERYTAGKAVRDALVEGWEASSENMRYIVPSEGTVVYYKDYIKLPALEQVGYDFKGWDIDGVVYPAGMYQIVGISDPDGSHSTGVSFNAVAVFTPRQYTITFDPIRYNLPPSQPTVFYAYFGSNETVDHIPLSGLVATLSAAAEGITHTGYEFSGWSPSSLVIPMPAEDVTLSAIWTPIYKSIQYECDSHSTISVTVSGQPHESSAVQNIPYDSPFVITVILDEGVTLDNTSKTQLESAGKLTTTTERVEGKDLTKITVTGNLRNNISISVTTHPTVYVITIASSNEAFGTVDKGSLSVPYGTAISKNGNTLTVGANVVTATPTPNTPTVKYTFTGWGEFPATVRSNVSITAVFSTDTVYYHVTFPEGISAVNRSTGEPIGSGDNLVYGTSVLFTATANGAIGISPSVDGKPLAPLKYAGKDANGKDTFEYLARYATAEMTVIEGQYKQFEGMSWAVSYQYGYMSIRSDTASYRMPDFQSYAELPWYNDYKFLKYVSIRDNVMSIGAHAFDGCEALTSVTIYEDGLNYIGDHAFQNCTGLASVSFTADMGIGIASFANCTSLRSLTFAYGTSISDYSFQGCTSLVSVTADSVNIPAYSFQNCVSLTSFNIASESFNENLIGSDAFGGCHLTLTIGSKLPIEIDGRYSYEADVPESNASRPNAAPANNGQQSGDTSSGDAQNAGSASAAPAGTDSDATAPIYVPVSDDRPAQPVMEKPAEDAAADIGSYIEYVPKPVIPAETVDPAVITDTVTDETDAVDDSCPESSEGSVPVPLAAVSATVLIILAAAGIILLARRH